MSDKVLESELPFMTLSDVEIVSIFGRTKDQYNFEFSELKKLCIKTAWKQYLSTKQCH